MTNGDKIRQMTNEEFAEIMRGTGCPPNCNQIEIDCNIYNNGKYIDCEKCWLDWLEDGV